MTHTLVPDGYAFRAHGFIAGNTIYVDGLGPDVVIGYLTRRHPHTGQDARLGRPMHFDAESDLRTPLHVICFGGAHCYVYERIDPDTAALLQADRAYEDAALGAEEDDAGDWHDQRARREAYDDTPIDPDNVPF